MRAVETGSGCEGVIAEGWIHDSRYGFDGVIDKLIITVRKGGENEKMG